MAKGTIRRLIADRGFGFIQAANGTDLFFHRSELEEVDYNSLTEGQQLEYEIGRGRSKRPADVFSSFHLWCRKQHHRSHKDRLDLCKASQVYYCCHP